VSGATVVMDGTVLAVRSMASQPITATSAGTRRLRQRALLDDPTGDGLIGELIDEFA
jgi:hypothetical protein